MRSKEFDIVHDRGNQHTMSSIEGSWDKSILVAKPHHAIMQRKDHITGKKQENQCLISTYDLAINMHLIKDRSDTTVGERSRKTKKFVPMNQDPKIIQERSHTRFRPLLTNSCSGRRVGEAGGRSGSSRSRSPTNSPSFYPTNKSLEQISEKKKKLLEEGSKLWSLYRYPHIP